MKLNIGSAEPRGKYKGADWINIDSGRAWRGAKLIDALDMPPEWDGTFDEVHAIHVLEHVNKNKRFDFLAACYRVMQPGATICVEVPDFEYTVRNLLVAIEQGNRDLEHCMTTSLFGKQQHPGDHHCWGYTSRTLTELIGRAQFRDLQVYLSRDDVSNMVSEHWLMEPVILVKASK